MITYNPYNWKIKKATNKTISGGDKYKEMEELLQEYRITWNVLMDLQYLIQTTDNEFDRLRLITEYFVFDGKLDFILKKIRNLYI